MQEINIINEIKSNLSRDSSQRAKQNAAIKYSDWFYNNHGHDYSLHNQKTCAQKTIDIVGIDVNTAVEIQYRVIRAYTIAENLQAVHETIQQHHLIASQAIQGQMLNQVQKQVPVHKGLPSAAPTGTDVVICNSKEKLPASKMSFGYQQNKAMAEFIKAIKESDVASSTKSIVFKNCDIEDFDLSSLSQVFKYQSWNLNTVSFAGNKIKSPEYIFNMYSFGNMHGKGVSIMHIDLSNNTGFGDITAKWIANELPKGNMPALKVLDLHGTSMTKVGYGYLAKALKSNTVQDIAITMETVSTVKQAASFFASWFNLKAIEHQQKGQETPWSTKSIATDQDSLDRCLNGLGFSSGATALGVVKQSAKKVGPLKLFMAILKDGGPQEILNSDLVYCLESFNRKVYGAPEDMDHFTNTLVGETHDSCEIM